LKKVQSFVTRKLNKEQEAKVFKLVTTYWPHYLGLRQPYNIEGLFFWSRDLLKQLIKKQCEIEIADRVVVNYLTRWGIKPLNRAKTKLEQCDSDIQCWWKTHGEEVLARSKSENAKIFWMGEIGLIGLEKVESSRNKRLTNVPVIENQGRMHWLTFQGEFNDEKQVMFLNSLKRQSRTKIFLIRKTSTHFNKWLVKHWLKDNKDYMEIFPPPDVDIKK